VGGSASQSRALPMPPSSRRSRMPGRPRSFSWATPAVQIAAVPTIDLTVHFRASLPLKEAKAEDYYLTVFRAREAREGFFEEDGEIWSRDGILVAQSRQLAILM
jgi:acyl-CoA thioesterase